MKISKITRILILIFPSFTYCMEGIPDLGLAKSTSETDQPGATPILLYEEPNRLMDGPEDQVMVDRPDQNNQDIHIDRQEAIERHKHNQRIRQQKIHMLFDLFQTIYADTSIKKGIVERDPTLLHNKNKLNTLTHIEKRKKMDIEGRLLLETHFNENDISKATKMVATQKKKFFKEKRLTQKFTKDVQRIENSWPTHASAMDKKCDTCVCWLCYYYPMLCCYPHCCYKNSAEEGRTLWKNEWIEEEPRCSCCTIQ